MPDVPSRLHVRSGATAAGHSSESEACAVMSRSSARRRAGVELRRRVRARATGRSTLLIRMTPEQEDVAFVLEACDGVAAIVALPVGGDAAYAVLLRPFNPRHMAAAHYALVRAFGYGVAGRVRFLDAAATSTSIDRGERLELSPDARARATSRAAARSEHPDANSEAEARVRPSIAPEALIGSESRALVVLD